MVNKISIVVESHMTLYDVLMEAGREFARMHPGESFPVEINGELYRFFHHRIDDKERNLYTQSSN